MKTALKNAITDLTTLRLEVADVFASMPEPTFKYGLNIFHAPSAIAVPDAVSDAAIAAPRVITPAGVEVMPLSVASRDPRFSELIRERLALADGDRVDVWNIASLGDGMFIYVPEGFAASSPVHVDLRVSESRRADCTVILAEKGSEVTVVEHLASEAGTGKLRAARTEIVARDGAKVTHVSVQDFGAGMTSYDRRRASVARDGGVTWIDCAFGGDYVRSRIETDLQGAGASARIMSMCFATDAQRFDVRHAVRHLAAHTVSDIRTRNALAGRAKAIYRGLVRIAPDARGCNGSQKEDTLLLSPDAEIDAMPDLEIGTGDVRAGHSASAGGLDKEKLFYLMSRGLDGASAKRTLIEAFFEPVARDMHGSGLEDMVNCLIAARLENATH